MVTWWYGGVVLWAACLDARGGPSRPSRSTHDGYTQPARRFGEGPGSPAPAPHQAQLQVRGTVGTDATTPATSTLPVRSGGESRAKKAQHDHV